MESEELFPTADEDEAAAAMVAVMLYIAAKQQAHSALDALPRTPWGWNMSRFLINQGLEPARTPRRPSWSSIERLWRASTGVAGITGS